MFRFELDKKTFREKLAVFCETDGQAFENHPSNMIGRRWKSEIIEVPFKEAILALPDDTAWIERYFKIEGDKVFGNGHASPGYL